MLRECFESARRVCDTASSVPDSARGMRDTASDVPDTARRVRDTASGAPDTARECSNFKNQINMPIQTLIL